jgi:probable phosphoglycerate mutase
LLREGVGALYSSDLVRARQTAELIGSALSLTAEVSPALRERSVGVFTGLTFDEARARYPEAYETLLRREHDVAPPEGESYSACQARAMAFIEEVLSRHAGQRVVLVSHYLTLYLCVLRMLGLPPDAAGPQVYVQMHNCALHRLERYADGGWQVVALNDTAHLRSLRA